MLFPLPDALFHRSLHHWLGVGRFRRWWLGVGRFRRWCVVAGCDDVLLRLHPVDVIAPRVPLFVPLAQEIQSVSAVYRDAFFWYAADPPSFQIEVRINLS